MSKQRILAKDPATVSNLRDALVNDIAEDREVVELAGFEPATPCLQSRCSPN